MPRCRDTETTNTATRTTLDISKHQYCHTSHQDRDRAKHTHTTVEMGEAAVQHRAGAAQARGGVVLVGLRIEVEQLAGWAPRKLLASLLRVLRCARGCGRPYPSLVNLRQHLVGEMASSLRGQGSTPRCNNSQGCYCPKKSRRHPRQYLLEPNHETRGGYWRGHVRHTNQQRTKP